MAKNNGVAITSDSPLTAANGSLLRRGAATDVHLSLQGKGGVGKSFVASILAQYLVARNVSVRCVDTDPINFTLSQYRALNAEKLDLLYDNVVSQRAFDKLMQRLLTEDGTFIIDNGASTFIALWAYIVENGVVDLLQQSGRRLYVHTVITGGQGLLDTLAGFKSLAESTKERNIVVWLNDYFGKVESDGKRFEDMAAYRDHSERVHGMVQLVKRNHDTFGRDLEEIVTRKQTLAEAIEDSQLTIMSRQRIRVMQREWFEQLDKLGF